MQAMRGAGGGIVGTGNGSGSVVPGPAPSGVSGSVVTGNGPRSQGPPPPYHQTTRSASVPIAIQSPNPSSPNNPTSNLSLPSPRASSALNSPADCNRQFQLGGTTATGSRPSGPGHLPGQSPTNQDSPNPTTVGAAATNRLNHSNPGTPVSHQHLSAHSPSGTPQKDLEFSANQPPNGNVHLYIFIKKKFFFYLMFKLQRNWMKCCFHNKTNLINAFYYFFFFALIK